MNVLADCCRSRQLIAITPEIPIEPVIRGLYVTPEIFNQLENANTDPATGGAWGSMRGVMDHFVSGKLMNVAQNTRRSHRPTHQMSLLEPVANGVWELRATTPRPGIRVLGCFVQQDQFAALAWQERNLLGLYGSREWRDIILGCQTQWRNLFHTYHPINGASYDEYVTNIFLS